LIDLLLHLGKNEETDLVIV